MQESGHRASKRPVSLLDKLQTSISSSTASPEHPQSSGSYAPYGPMHDDLRTLMGGTFSYMSPLTSLTFLPYHHLGHSLLLWPRVLVIWRMVILRIEITETKEGCTVTWVISAAIGGGERGSKSTYCERREAVDQGGD